MEMLLLISNDKNSTVYHQSRSLLTAICGFEFIFGLYLLKVILLTTDALIRYLQGKNLDQVITKKKLIQLNKDVEMRILLIVLTKVRTS